MLTQNLCSSTKVGGRIFRAACVVAATAALAGCNGSQNAYAPPPPPKVAVAQPLQKPVTLYLNLTGNTSPFNSVDLVARVQGFLTDIDYTDGAAVKSGDKLFGIERDQYQAQLDQANATLASNQATLAYNQAEYQRQATLGKQDFASQATVQEWKSKADEAAAQVLNAKAAIETAQINLNYTTVTAPFDGVVTRHLVDMGALVGVGSPTKLATIIQLDPLYVYFTISEPQILRIKVNNAKAGIEFRTTDLSKIPVEIGLQGEEGFPHLGHMDYAAPQVDAIDRHARSSRDLRQQGPWAAAWSVRPRPDAGRETGQGNSCARCGARDEPGGPLSAGGRAGQCRPAQNRQDGRPGGRLPHHRVGNRSWRLDRDGGRAARSPGRQG